MGNDTLCRQIFSSKCRTLFSEIHESRVEEVTQLVAFSFVFLSIFLLYKRTKTWGYFKSKQLGTNKQKAYSQTEKYICLPDCLVYYRHFTTEDLVWLQNSNPKNQQI